jgi:hypothetical protein
MNINQSASMDQLRQKKCFIDSIHKVTLVEFEDAFHNHLQTAYNEIIHLIPTKFRNNFEYQNFVECIFEHS